MIMRKEKMKMVMRVKKKAGKLKKMKSLLMMKNSEAMMKKSTQTNVDEGPLIKVTI